MREWDMKDIYYRLDESERELQKTLDDGWEPFAVGYEGRVIVYFFRKKHVVNIQYSPYFYDGEI